MPESKRLFSTDVFPKCVINPPPTQPPPPPGICVSAETMSSSLCVPYVSRLMCPFMMCVPSYSSPYSCDSFTLCQQQPCDPWFDLVWLLCPPRVSCRSRAPGRCCSGLRLSNPRTTEEAEQALWLSPVCHRRWSRQAAIL